jgi:AraC-like DNA-binding protein
VVQHLGERYRTATFGPIVLSLTSHGNYDTVLPGNNFGYSWRAARIYFPLDGELRFRHLDNENPAGGERSNLVPVGPRGAALTAGWHPVRVATEGAQALEVDIATERFEMKTLLNKFKFALWAPESLLPGATAAALRELLENPGSSAPIRAETARVVEGLIGSLLVVAHNRAELRHGNADSSSNRNTNPKLSETASNVLIPPKSDYAAIMKLISKGFSNPELSPATMAAQLGISLRTLYRCFEDGGEANGSEGISKAIAGMRLAAALAKLTDPLQSHLTLEEVAGACGYRSALGMRRAVLAETGRTPSVLRANVAV